MPARILPFTPEPEPQPTNEAEARALDERRMQGRAAYAKLSTRLLAFGPPEPLPDFDEDGNPIVWLADASLQGFLHADALRRVREAREVREGESKSRDVLGPEEQPRSAQLPSSARSVAASANAPPEPVAPSARTTRDRLSPEQWKVWGKLYTMQKYGRIVIQSLPPDERKARLKRLVDIARSEASILPPEEFEWVMEWFRPRPGEH